MAKYRKPRRWSRRIKVICNEPRPTDTLTYTILFGEKKEITLSSPEAEDVLWQLGKHYLGDSEGRIGHKMLIGFFAEERYGAGTEDQRENDD